MLSEIQPFERQKLTARLIAASFAMMGESQVALIAPTSKIEFKLQMIMKPSPEALELEAQEESVKILIE